MLNNIFYRILQKLKYHFSINSFNKRVAEINRFEKIVKCKGNSFFVKGCNLQFLREVHDFILDNVDLFRKLNNDNNISFSLQGKVMICEVGNEIQLTVNTSEELFIINEIWLEGCYNVFIRNREKVIVIDVGMNVGYASLFFASRPSVEKVFSFEPLEPTFLQGLANLNRNEVVKGKINTHNYGLSDKEAELEIDYSKEHRGRMGKWGTDLVLEKINETVKERLALKPFNEVIKEIAKGHPNHEFIWKIDCEGSEYDIFKTIDADVLKNVRAIMIEWHRQGPQPLENILKENNFSLLSLNPSNNKVGMLYAFR